MFNCFLVLKNKSEWIEYTKNILKNTDNINDDIIIKILTFPFRFGSANEYS